MTNRRSRRIRKLMAKTGMSYQKALELDRQRLWSNADIAAERDTFDVESVVLRPVSDRAAGISFVDRAISAGTLYAGLPDPAIGQLSAAFTDPLGTAAGQLSAAFTDPLGTAAGQLSAAFTDLATGKLGTAAGQLSAAFTDLATGKLGTAADQLSAAFTDPLGTAAGQLSAAFTDLATGKLGAAFPDPAIGKLYWDGGLGHVSGADERS